MLVAVCGCARPGDYDVAVHPFNHVTPAGRHGLDRPGDRRRPGAPDAPRGHRRVPAPYVVVLHAETYPGPPSVESEFGVTTYAGYCYLRPFSEIHVGSTWREFGDAAWVEVYRHEVNHARTQDPLEGHRDVAP